MIPLFMILSGAVAALPLLFPKLFFLSWIALAPFICTLIIKCERGLKKRGSFGIAFSWFLGYFLVIYHWFCYLYPMDFLGFTPPMAVATIAVCWLGLALLQAFQMAFAGLIFRLLYRGRRMLAPFIFASAWLLCEWAQTQTWMGVPWARLALSQTEVTANIQSASLFGSLGLGFIIALANGFIALALLKLISAKKKRKLIAIPLALSAVIIYAANAGYGVYRISSLYSREDEDKAKIALIQGNISSTEKWQSGMTEYALEVYLNMTRDAAEKHSPDLVLWPETVIPTSVLSNEWITREISYCARETGTVILVGCFDTIRNGDKTGKYNAIVAFYPNGEIDETPYYKRHLVPFGEYLPMEGIIDRFLPMLSGLSSLAGDLTEGGDSAIIHTEHGSIGALICFDSIYETLTLDSVRDGAEIMILSTNDSWYGDSAAIRQHNAHAKLRAVEVGRYIARAANTGISSVIDYAGNSIGELDALNTGYLVGELFHSNEITLYTQIGNLPVYIALVFAVILYFAKRLAAEIKRYFEENRN